MCAPATPQILVEFDSTNHLESTILVSIWELGEVVGPLLIGPLSEIYGRLPVYHVANILFIACSAIAAESRNINMLVAFRFMLGMAVASTTLNPCIVGDMFEPMKRGRAIAVMGVSVPGHKALSSRRSFYLIELISDVMCYLRFREAALMPGYL